MVAGPQLSQRRRTHLGSGRRLWRPAAVCRAGARPRGHGQCRPLRRASSRHDPARHLHPGRAAGGEGLGYISTNMAMAAAAMIAVAIQPSIHCQREATNWPMILRWLTTIIIAAMIGTTMT